MDAVVAYILSRLREASTLRGLVLLGFGLAGIDVSDTQADELISAGITLAGLLGTALPDKLSK